MDIIGMHFGSPLLVHDPALCEGTFCCIHKPSPHHMVSWPQVWRNDRKFMERRCPHGIGHPDPDDINVQSYPEEFGVHGCDGCCRRRR